MSLTTSNPGKAAERRPPTMVTARRVRGVQLRLSRALSRFSRWSPPAACVSLAAAVSLLPVTSVGAAGQDSGNDAGHRVRLTCEFQLRPDNISLLDWLQRGGWCWGVASRPEITDEMLLELKKRGLCAVVTVMAHPDVRRRQWSDEWKLPVPDIGMVMARYRQILGTNFAWEAFTEDDSMGVAFSQELLRVQPATHREARELFGAYLSKAMDEMHPQAAVEKWGRSGYASSAHPLAALGLDCVLVERANDDVEDLQTAVAMARGAARQYGCQWGVDFSLWWGAIYGCVHDLPASFHKRNFYLSYFSGAGVLAVEGGELLLRGRNKFSRLGEALEEFGQFTRRVLPGTADVPVAVIVPEDHGWMTPPYWRTASEAWNYARIPYRPGDASMDGFFSAAFPGATFAMDPFPFGAYATNHPPASPFSLSSVTTRYAPLSENAFTATPPIPFGRYASRDAARRALEAGHIDPSPWRPLGNSRWGDILDVLTVTAPGHVLNRYEVLVLAGPVQIDRSLRARIETYVKGGGTLVAAAGVLGPADRDWCGVEIEPELRVGQAWLWGKSAPIREPFRFVPGRPASRQGEVLARTPGGDCLVVRHAFGKGSIHSVLLPWFGSGEAPLAKLSLRLLDEVIGGVQRVSIDGLPVEWLSTHAEDHRTVVLANHDGRLWRGKVTVRDVPAGLRHCQELLSNDTIAFSRRGNECTCTIEVPAYDVRAVRWSSGP